MSYSIATNPAESPLRQHRPTALESIWQPGSWARSYARNLSTSENNEAARRCTADGMCT